MQTQKNAKSKRSLKEVAYIAYLLKLKGLTQQDIANNLAISRQAVNRVISGSASSKRVRNWLETNLGVKFDN